MVKPQVVFGPPPQTTPMKDLGEGDPPGVYSEKQGIGTLDNFRDRSLMEVQFTIVSGQQTEKRKKIFQKQS